MASGTTRVFVAGAFVALATATLAQQTTLSIPFFGYDSMPIDASIIGVQNHATTMALACPHDTDSSDCGLAPFQTLVIGPSTYNMNLLDSGFTFTQSCAVSTAQSTAVCAESAGGSEANFPGSSTTAYNGTDYTVMPVTVTAGATLLGLDNAQAASTTTSTAAASSSSETSSATTGAVTSSAPTAGQTATTHGASSTSATSSATSTTTGSRTSSASNSPATGAAAPIGANSGSFGVAGAFVVAMGAALL